MAEPTLAEITQQIEVLETAEEFGQQLQLFTDFLDAASGDNVTEWLSDDSTVQYELDQLKDAAFQFSEALNGLTEFAEPLAKAAETAGNINTVVSGIQSFAEAVAKADASTGAEKASQLADVISGVSDLAQLLSGLSLNPVIGVFIGLYATALQSAAVGLEQMDAYATRRNEIINSRGGELDIDAELARREAEADRADAAEQRFTRELNELYAKRGELIAALQGTQYQVALDYCASRNREALQGLIARASEHGGIASNATPNGDSLARVEEIVSELAGSAFDLVTQAASLPEGSEARANAVERAEALLDTKRELTDGLRPLRDCVKDALEQYGFSTASAGPGTTGGRFPRRLVIGGGGILAAAMVGVVIMLGGGGDDGVSSDGPDGGGSPASGGTVAAVVGASPGDACEALREQQLVLDLTSPDVQPTIPLTFSQGSGYDLGFPTPALEWSAVPPETTEIAVLVQWLRDDRAAEYQLNPGLWWNLPFTEGGGVPVGATRWTLTGIDAGATGLASSSLSNPPPPGTVEQNTSTAGVTVNGEQTNTKFVGPDLPGRYYMFTVFALCDPVEGASDDYRAGWLKRHSVAIGWFISEAAW